MLQRIIVITCLAVVGCSHKNDSLKDRVRFDPSTNQVNADRFLSLGVAMIKNKESKFDIELVLENQSENTDLLILAHDLHCNRGKTKGTIRLKHARVPIIGSAFNIGERKIDLMIGEQKRFVMVCHHRKPDQGDYTVIIKRIYTNPTGDGRTRGKVIAKNLTWILEEPH